jgi:hypothetical protein
MTEESKLIPEEFTKVIKDFINDLKITFPEYGPLISKWWKEPENFSYIEEEEERNKAYEKSVSKSIKLLFEFCQKKLPPRFFDVLYQNEDIFKEGTDTDTEFLPKIHFKDLWQCEITQKTRDTIWKYLQLITFSIIGTIHNKEAFGDTAKLFEAINEDEFKNKLHETLSQIEGLFDLSGNFSNFAEGLGAGLDGLGSGLGSGLGGGMPDAEQLHEHITGMLDGKLGQLAREIAEETASDLNMDFEGATDMKDIFQSLLKNPTKLMGLVKNVGDKLDTKIKSGDLKESEIIAEATEMMNKMKNMPGLDNIQSLLSKMGMGNLGGLGGKVNTGAMEANLNKKLKMAQTKERIRAKAEANAKAKLEQQILAQQQQQQQQMKPAVSEEEILKIFSTGEKIERTPRGVNPQNNNANKKKKSKK